MVEFALVIPLVLVLVLAVAEVAVVARAELQLVHAAREGARHAATSPDTGATADAVRRSLGAAGDRARISVSRPSTVGVPAMVSVTIRHRVAAPVFGGFVVRLGASSTMRTER